MRSPFQRIHDKFYYGFINRVAKPLATSKSIASQEKVIERGLSSLQNKIKPAGYLQSNFDVSINVNENIPQLAWLCLRDNKNGYQFTAGRSVEVFENGIFEGAWAGDFANLATAASSEVYGSGALFDSPNPLFIQRTDVREFIYILRDKHAKIDYISNSFNFILSKAEISQGSDLFLALEQSLVSRTFADGRKGFHRANPKVVETNRYVFYRPYYTNFRIQNDGTFSFEQPFLGVEFRDYKHYKSFLLDITRRVFENGSHPNRKKKLTPLTSISSGYDSTGVSVLAKLCGCREAVTIGGSIGEANDSGEAVAKVLGLHLHEFDHFAGEEVPNLRLAATGPMKSRLYEFIATSGIGDDSTFLAFESMLEGRVFLTGVGGDATWDKHYFPAIGLPVDIRFARSLTEFRLRLGFAHFGPILAASASPSSIVRLSNSLEMAPFSVNRNYDRPIPRRLVEEEGVDRELFGAVKRATAPDFTDASELWGEAVQHIMKRYKV